MENSLDKADINSKPQLKSWKQWFLIYPTFAIAVLGAIPQYINVIKGLAIGVETSKVSYSEYQHKLWMKNVNCNLSLSTIKTIENSSLSIGACPTGDIQINIIAPDDDKRFVRWFDFDELKNVNSIHNGIFDKLGISTAIAEEIVPLKIQLARSDSEVMCQKLLSKRKLIRIIREGEQCYKETINTYTGKVEERIVVKCSSSCQVGN